MNTNLNSYKERVKLLRKAVSTVLNVECSQSQAYEILAKEENYPNWDALSASIKNNKNELTVAPLLTKKEQLIQLTLLHTALKNDGPLFETIELFLKKQSNPILKEGWNKVNMSQDVNYSNIFKQTGFFNDDVVSLIEISAWSGTVESGIKSAIEFLKLDLD